MTTAHTATPWRAKTGNGWHHIYIVGECVASFEKNVATVPTHETGFADAEFIVRACNAYAGLVEYFNASESLQLTIGHESASADDEAKAEDRFQAARKAVREAHAKAGAA